jgi:hypothetical protein
MKETSDFSYQIKYVFNAKNILTGENLKCCYNRKIPYSSKILDLRLFFD